MKKPTFLLLIFTLIMVNSAFAQLTFTNAAQKGSYFTFTPTPSNPDFHMKGQKTMIRGTLITTKMVFGTNPNARCNVYAHHYTNNGTKFLLITEMIYDDNYLLETNKWYFQLYDIDWEATKRNKDGKLIIRMFPSRSCVNIITAERFSDDSMYSLSDYGYSIELSKYSTEDFLNYIKSIK